MGSGVEREGLGLANDSNLGGAPLGRSAITSHRVSVVDDRMHGDEAGEGDAQGADDLAAHGFGDQGGAAGHVQLEHGRRQALLHGAGRDLKMLGDLFGGEALGNVQQALQFARRQTTAEVAYPCADGDRVHDVFSGSGCIGRNARCRVPPEPGEGERHDRCSQPMGEPG